MDVPPELAAVTPAVLAVVAALRTAGLPDRWTPLTAILVGVAGALCVALATGGLGVAGAVIAGITTGAAATGLHQTGHQLVRKGPRTTDPA